MARDGSPGPPLSFLAPRKGQKKAWIVELGFLGNETQGIDGKGRVSIPADFRGALVSGDTVDRKGERPQFVLVYGTVNQNHIKCYTIRDHEAIKARIRLMQDGTPAKKHANATYIAMATYMPLGEDGRIVLPAKLRAKLAIEDKVFFIADFDHFKMWKPETYDAVEAGATDAWLEQMGPDFDILSLIPPLPTP